MIDLGHPMLLNYLANIENIGRTKRAAPYRAGLTALDEQVRLLENLRQADDAAIVEIEVVCQRIEPFARQEEFHH